MDAYKNKVQSKSGVIVTDGLGSDVMQGIAAGAGILMAALVGAWAFSSLVAGVIAAGGPAKLVASWFQAVSGM